jgi:SAM-dependent methyltransferase
MERIVEPELMDDPDQARAYALANFEAPHNEIIDCFSRMFAGAEIEFDVIDLGCGPADITVRFARRYPYCRIDGVDGAQAMLSHARIRVEEAGLGDRIRLLHLALPTAELARAQYATVISNSLLHHLHDPMVLWSTVKHVAAPGARIFIADLMRPETPDAASRIVQQYAADEPKVLRRDFYNSLCAAFTMSEIRAQLAASALDRLEVNALGDRHLFVWGDCA